MSVLGRKILSTEPSNFFIDVGSSSIFESNPLTTLSLYEGVGAVVLIFNMLSSMPRYGSAWVGVGVGGRVGRGVGGRVGSLGVGIPRIFNASTPHLDIVGGFVGGAVSGEVSKL